MQTFYPYRQYAKGTNLRAVCHSRIEAWRKAAQPRIHRGFNGEGRHRVPVFYCDSGAAPFRNEKPVHESEAWKDNRGREFHSGWYTDPDGMSSKDGTGLCWGIVAQVHGHWIAGYEVGGSDGQTWFMDLHETERDACRTADEHARVIAEREREYQERWRAAADCQQRIEENTACVRTDFPFRHAVHKGKKNSVYIRQWIENIRADREELATTYKDIEL